MREIRLFISLNGPACSPRRARWRGPHLKMKVLKAREILGDKIKDLRQSMGLSARKFGLVMGITTRVVYNLEEGIKPQINIEDLFGLLDAGLCLDTGPPLIPGGIKAVGVKEESSQEFVERILNTNPEALSKFCHLLRHP